MTGTASPADGAQAASSEKEELQREQLVLANQKLKIETQNLERQSAPDHWWSRFGKNIVAFGGIVTVAASLIGIWDSYNKTIVDRQRTRVADQRSRLEDAVKRLENPSTISKLVGVAVLGGYLDVENKEAHRQVLFTLAGLMATEKDVQTQVAVIDLLSAIPAKGPITELDWFYFQDILVSQSRALVEKGGLATRRSFAAGSPLSDEERAARVVGKLVALNIRKGAVPGYTKYSGIYCVDCDFHDSAFLRGTSFAGAILDSANFNGSRLEGANFDGAQLLGSTFAAADLREARFRSLRTSGADGGEVTQRFPRTAYLDNIVRSLDVNATITIRMPRFNCANLEGADFSGHALFPGFVGVERKYAKGDDSKAGWYRNAPDYVKELAETRKEAAKFAVVRLFPPSFFKAILKGASFKDSLFFTIGAASDPSDFMASASAVRTGEFLVWIGHPDNDLFELRPEDKADSKKEERDNTETLRRELGRARQRLSGAFFMAVMDNVSLPERLSTHLKAASANIGDYRSAFRLAQFTAADVERGCGLSEN